jgi:antitoxin (DNA-binding transcriptional repressor) of toxin-antitoxin stability system
MSITVTIPEASQQFAQLIGKVLQGEEIIICENGIAIAAIASCYLVTLRSRSVSMA